MSHNGRMRLLRVAGLMLCALMLWGATDPESKLTVEVKSATTGRAIEGASVIVRFHPGSTKVKMDKSRNTSWETKTSQQGTVSIPGIPLGEIGVQIIAKNYQTYGDVYQLTQAEQTISIKLNPPQPQYSEDAKKK